MIRIITEMAEISVVLKLATPRSCSILLKGDWELIIKLVIGGSVTISSAVIPERKINIRISY